MIEKTKRENENLTKLKSQMKDMSAAFEVLKNTRIENKRQMEQKKWEKEEKESEASNSVD